MGLPMLTLIRLDKNSSAFYSYCRVYSNRPTRSYAEPLKSNSYPDTLIPEDEIE